MKGHKSPKARLPVHPARSQHLLLARNSFPHAGCRGDRWSPRPVVTQSQQNSLVMCTFRFADADRPEGEHNLRSMHLTLASKNRLKSRCIY